MRQVQAISVGVNSGSAPPDVPRGTPFLWRDEPSGAQLIAMWHPGGYSGNPVDTAAECMQVCCKWLQPGHMCISLQKCIMTMAWHPGSCSCNPVDTADKCLQVKLP